MFGTAGAVTTKVERAKALTTKVGEKKNYILQHKVGKYRIDLYFPKPINLAIEIDENNHSNYN